MLETFSNSMCGILFKPRRHYFGFIKLSIADSFLFHKKVKSAWKLHLNDSPQLLHYIRLTIVYYFHHIANQFVPFVIWTDRQYLAQLHIHFIVNYRNQWFGLQSILEELPIWSLYTNTIYIKKIGWKCVADGNFNGTTNKMREKKIENLCQQMLHVIRSHVFFMFYLKVLFCSPFAATAGIFCSSFVHSMWKHEKSMRQKLHSSPIFPFYFLSFPLSRSLSLSLSYLWSSLQCC